MGKYMRKAKTSGDVAVMDVVSQSSSFGVRTRAKTLALKKSQSQSPSSSSSGSYLQLRNRRLEKPPVLIHYSKRQRQASKDVVSVRNPRSSIPAAAATRASSRLRHGVVVASEADVSVSVDRTKEDCERPEEKDGVKESHENENDDFGVLEASFGDNVLEFEGRERTTRESTPCSLIRDPDIIRTPGSTTRPTCSTEANRRSETSRRHIPTAREMDEFFSDAEEAQQKRFVEKYNYDPVNDKPLPGRYEWEKLKP